MFLARQLRTLQADHLRLAAKTFSEEGPGGPLTPEQVIAWLNNYADGIEGVSE